MYKTNIGHVHLKVRDLERSIDFYTKVLNFKVTERVSNHYAFLTGGDAHHELALQNVGSDAPESDPAGVGLYHAAFEVPDRQAFAEVYKNLKAMGIEVSPINHHISWALYFSDPDGNGLEIYWDTRKEKKGAELWRGFSEVLKSETILSDF
ncbi:MAG: VOC family protein [Ignavibacteriae bacterium]|nr:VOC family protein [Ignavibacteriota bacterium]